MALNLVCAVLDRGPRDLAEMAVLLAIADSADRDTGEAWPSQRTIAERARQSDRNVRRVLERLRVAGWLTWEDRTRPNGSATSNLYTINLAQLGEVPRVRITGGAEPRSTHAPDPRSGGGGPTVRGGADPRSTHAPDPRSAPEPSQNKEPSRKGSDLDLKERVLPSLACSDGVGGFAVCTGSASDPAQVDVAALSGFQRTQFLRGDASVQVARHPVLFGSPEYSRVVELLGNGVM